MNNVFTWPIQPDVENVVPPMVYVRQELGWEYKHIARRLNEESMPSEAELNALGAEGWELAGIVVEAANSHFYFKRLQETG